MSAKPDQSIIFIAVAIVIVAGAIFVSGGNTEIGSLTVEASESAKTITTSGDAEAKVAPDKVQISVGVETESLSASESQDENRQISNAIMQRISSLGISSNNIKTTQLTVHPISEYNPFTREVEDRGFRTTHIITVTTSKLDIVGKLVDDVADAGANRIDNIVFMLEDETEENLRKQLLDAAAEEARQKADAIASGLGIRVAGVSSASENSFQAVPFFARSDMAVMEAAAEPTQVSPGEVEVSASVSVVFDIQ